MTGRDGQRCAVRDRAGGARVARFILIGGKVGDLIGRKRAYVLGLLGYAVGALAMTLAQGLTAIIVFWA
jgi:MFS family permease